MTERRIFSCDWCNVDAPEANSVGENWQRILSTPPEWVCGECWEVRAAAIAKARAARSGSEADRG